MQQDDDDGPHEVVPLVDADVLDAATLGERGEEEDDDENGNATNGAEEMVIRITATVKDFEHFPQANV